MKNVHIYYKLFYISNIQTLIRDKISINKRYELNDFFTTSNIVQNTSKSQTFFDSYIPENVNIIYRFYIKLEVIQDIIQTRELKWRTIRFINSIRNYIFNSIKKCSKNLWRLNIKWRWYNNKIQYDDVIITVTPPQLSILVHANIVFNLPMNVLKLKI